MNSKSLLNIVKVETVKFIENFKTIDLKEIANKAQYKPNKKNIKVITFITRMKTKYLEEIETNKNRLEKNLKAINIYKKIEANEKFEFVVINKNQKQDIFGKKIPIKIGDKMELISVAKHFKMELDIEYYIDKLISGPASRLINYYYETEYIGSGFEYRKLDEKLKKHATAELMKYIEEKNIVEIKQDNTQLSKFIYKQFESYYYFFIIKKFISLTDILKLDRDELKQKIDLILNNANLVDYNTYIIKSIKIYINNNVNSDNLIEMKNIIYEILITYFYDNYYLCDIFKRDISILKNEIMSQYYDGIDFNQLIKSSEIFNNLLFFVYNLLYIMACYVYISYK